MNALGSLRQHARKVPKAVFWLMTPWRMPMRLQFLRDRAAREGKAQALLLLIEEERLRLEALQQGQSTTLVRPLDLCDTAKALEAAGLPEDQVLWSPVEARDVRDRRSAARFLLDTLRHRIDLRSRFPFSLSAPWNCGFIDWLNSAEGRSALGLTSEAIEHLVALLSNDFGAQARQFFLTNDEIRAVLPHGLMPSGRRSLFRWFMQHGLDASGLTREEVWWLFLEAAENPKAELVRAFLFTPAWQRGFPDALTVFGWSRFTAWFAATYGAEEAIADSSWPASIIAPAAQIRLAYFAQPAWNKAFPEALSDATAARALLEWLVSSGQAHTNAETRGWCAELDVEALVPDLLNGGVNIIGHFCYPSGLRVSVVAMTEALKLAGVPTSLRDVRTDAHDAPHHVRFDGLETGDVTVIHVQPEPFFVDVYARADLAEREPRTYRVAYWYWEFDSIPDSWPEHAKHVDEVWTATEFIARGLRDKLPIPVRTLFPGVALAPFPARERAYFGLDASRFTFLFTFHMVSVMERKNPLGLIRAFKMAFRPDEPVTLVLKTSFGDRHPVQFQELQDAVANTPSIVVIDEVFSSEDVLSLMNACDAYVSLHRSEGLGLTMAEAMLMGKPVIATAFSGNMDFMNDENSLLVSYERVKVGKPIPPYDAELEWAEPSVEHAAQLMRRIYDNPEYAREIGARGKLSAEVNLSLESAGRRMANRLAEIRTLQRSRK